MDTGYINSLLDRAGMPLFNTLEERIEALVNDLLSLADMVEVQGKETDIERLIRGLDNDRSVDLHLIADACFDVGNSKEGAAWKWLADNKKWPMQRLVFDQWGWEWRPQYGGTEAIRHFSDELRSIRPELVGDNKSWPTASAALLAAVEALVDGSFKPGE